MKKDKEHEMRVLQILRQFIQPRFQYSDSSQSFNPYKYVLGVLHLGATKFEDVTMIEPHQIMSMCPLL